MSVVKYTNTRECRLFHSNIATLAHGIKNELTAFTTEALARNLISSDGARAALNTLHPAHDRATALLLNLLDRISFHREEFNIILEILWNIPNLQTLATDVDPSYTGPHSTSNASRNNIGNVSSSVSTVESVANRVTVDVQSSTVTSHQRLSPNCKRERDDYHTLKHKTLEFQAILASLGHCTETITLNDQLVQLTDKASRLLNSKGISANQVIQIFPSLPQKVRFEYFQYMKNNLMKNAYTTSSHGLYGCLHFGLLKVSIDAFGSRALKDEMEKTIHDVLSLRSKVTAEDFIERFSSGVESLPPKYGKVQLHLNKEPDICTLQDLEDIRVDFIGEFMPKVSRNLVFLHQITRGSSVVSWGAPREAVEEASVIIFQDNDRSFFEKHGILSLFVDEKLAYSNTSPPAILDSISTIDRQLPSIQCTIDTAPILRQPGEPNPPLLRYLPHNSN